MDHQQTDDTTDPPTHHDPNPTAGTHTDTDQQDPPRPPSRSRGRSHG
jgi:hypothetical protein